LVQFTCTILQFAEQGEKTGWTYIKIPASIAQKLKPENKKSFRVRGTLDRYPIESIALLPMGAGNFILTLNATIRKGIQKTKGAKLTVKLEEDPRPLVLCPELMACLDDEPKALAFFRKLTKSHQFYFSKWIESGKTEETRAKRIGQTITAFLKGFGFTEMMRSFKENRIR
jgi:Domain of unknown function (DUF1905)/Bacteriocin-protection, YdeI or OmpD-Associated